MATREVKIRWKLTRATTSLCQASGAQHSIVWALDGLRSLPRATSLQPYCLWRMTSLGPAPLSTCSLLQSTPHFQHLQYQQSLLQHRASALQPAPWWTKKQRWRQSRDQVLNLKAFLPPDSTSQMSHNLPKQHHQVGPSIQTHQSIVDILRPNLNTAYLVA